MCITVRNEVPNIEKEGLQPYDFVVLTTKNCPDIPPTIVDLAKPAIGKDNRHTTIVLIQNGLNIEKPVLEAFPTTPILSGVSLIGSAEPEPGHIIHEDRDRLLVGAFQHPSIEQGVGDEKAKEFVRIYGAGGKTESIHSPNVLHDRWRKLVYNAALNPICAILGLDSGRSRLADGVVSGFAHYVLTNALCTLYQCSSR
jgi:ketopantoate reductase